jgi:hypothetical protein
MTELATDAVNSEPSTDLLPCPICGNNKRRKCSGCTGRGFVTEERRVELWPDVADRIVEELRVGRAVYLGWSSSTAETEFLEEKAKAARVDCRIHFDADTGFEALPEKRPRRTLKWLVLHSHLFGRLYSYRYFRHRDSRQEHRRREREQQRDWAEQPREWDQEMQEFFDRLLAGERVRLPFQERLPLGQLRKLATETRCDLRFDGLEAGFFTWFLLPRHDDD